MRDYRRNVDDEEPPELEPDDEPEDEPDDEPDDEDADDELDDDVLLELDALGELELDAPPLLDELELEPVGCVTPSAQPAMSPPPTSSAPPVSARRKLRRSRKASAGPRATDSFDAVVG